MSSRPAGLKTAQFWLLTLLAGVSLVLVAINITLSNSNQKIQSEINSRQQFINQTIQISRLNTQLIQTLANLSAQTGDQQLRALLAAHGISFNIPVPPRSDTAQNAGSADAADDESANVKKNN
jgi:hypothetical protein